MATEVARATMLIVPKFDGLTNSITDALSKAGASSSKAGEGLGKRTSDGFGKGLVSSGAAIGAFSTLTNAAMSSISAHVGDAVQRFDTLNNYPRTMEMLGYSSESAESSISKMSDRLSTLPTRLDDMASVVQGIVVTTGDLDQATDAGLALNDMLVASGANTQLVNAAMEQFRQMLSKGKPELEDWKSLTAAMPGQMDQLAKAMLGPTAGANDLYAALGGGKNEAVLSMDDLLNAMIRLDTEGGAGITSFKEQAETAAGGVQTALANMENAVTKGIAGTLDAIGRDNIAAALGGVKDAVTEVFSDVNGVVKGLAPIVADLVGPLADAAPDVLEFAASFGILNVAGGKAADVLGDAAGTGRKVVEAFRLMDAGAGTLAESLDAVGLSFSPVSVGIAAVSAAVAIGVGEFAEYSERMENLHQATRGLAEVTADTASLDSYAHTISDVGTNASFSAMGVNELAESTAAHVEAMRQNTEAAETEIAQLSTAQGIISQYAGQTDLTAAAQGRLEWALKLVNEQFGLSVTQADVASNSYKDQDGNVQNLTESLSGLIEKKKEEARVSAITENLTEAYQVQSDAADTLAQTQRTYNDAVAAAAPELEKMDEATRSASLAQIEQSTGLADARSQYDEACKSVSALEDELGTAAAATSEAADAYDALSSTMASADFTLFSSQLEAGGTSFEMLKEDLRELGADTTRFSQLSSDELQSIADAYDGSASSIVGTLQELGVGMSNAAAASQAMAESVAAALEEMGAADSLEKAGVSVEEFSQALADAGVSTEQLSAVGSENLSALASACGGNISQMVGYIEMYNTVPLLDKDGNVSVNDAKLIDAQGNVYTWNGSALVDKYGNAAIADTSVTDAQGHLWTWNGSTLLYKSGTGQVFDLMTQGIEIRNQWNSDGVHSQSGTGTVHDNMSGGITQRNEWNRKGLNSYEASGTINIFRNITETVSRIFGNAAGGIRPHAAGGIAPRYHAGGAIATQAVPLDIVGEDGAEAIVPLTNRKYSQPFADIIADGVRDKMGGGTVIYNTFKTKVVRADEDLYTAAPVIYRNAMRESRLMSR